jgi:hypothetical protein
LTLKWDYKELESRSQEHHSNQKLNDSHSPPLQVKFLQENINHCNFSLSFFCNKRSYYLFLAKLALYVDENEVNPFDA